jgi:hypothetical protein
MRLVKKQNFNSKENLSSKITYTTIAENAENCEMHLMPVRGIGNYEDAALAQRDWDLYGQRTLNPQWGTFEFVQGDEIKLK